MFIKSKHKISQILDYYINIILFKPLFRKLKSTLEDLIHRDSVAVSKIETKNKLLLIINSNKINIYYGFPVFVTLSNLLNLYRKIGIGNSIDGNIYIM